MNRADWRQPERWGQRGPIASVLLLGLWVGAGASGCEGATAKSLPAAAPCDRPAAAEPGAAVAVTSRPAASRPTVVEAEAFIAEVERDLRNHFVRRERASWVQANFITEDTQAISAEAARDTMQYLARTINAATRFDGVELPAELARKFRLLKLAATLPAPAAPAKAAELATLMARMEAAYGKAKVCPAPGGRLRSELARLSSRTTSEPSLACGAAGGGVALDDLRRVMALSRDEEALREAWLGWHDTGAAVRADYPRYVELGNEGAREIGFADVGQLWRSGYDMPAEAFAVDVERLWGQMKPFYDDLHCYVRAKLRKRYGERVVPQKAPIPAHLLGNMWAQSWENVYPLVEPYRGEASVDLGRRLVEQKYDAIKMVRTAEGFFTSLGLDPLPATFWRRSLFLKPADREVECHASAWDVTFADDLRIKMCIRPSAADFAVIHHELGHNYYQHYTRQQPILFQTSANDGFHEALGDTIGLSVTPAYLKRIGLMGRVPTTDRARVNHLMRMALDKVAFLPFGKTIDQWRWDVFAGRIAPTDYNTTWWELRRRYQGIVPPDGRSETQFDAGAKYHVPASVPYMRYFLAYVYQFQFHRALCRATGHSGPLADCSLYGNQEAGRRLRALMELGASRSWQEALFALSGERQADAGALLEYFAPLRKWLRAQTETEICGW